jgi:two-component system, OmpR family, sensor histidine kinase ChvG
MATGGTEQRRRRILSPITRRILVVNLLALGILVAGLLYLGEYRRNLIAAELVSLRTQAAMITAALGEGAVATDGPLGQHLVRDIGARIVRRMVAATGNRARIFDISGVLVADSTQMRGPRGIVEVEELPPPPSGIMGWVVTAYDSIADWLPVDDGIPLYREDAVQWAGDYDEVARALAGESGERVRATHPSGMILSAAMPVQRYKQVLGVLMLSKGSHHIDAAVFDVRLAILNVFAVALGITILLSVYLAGTIARPIRRLAAAAESVRQGMSRQHVIPDMAGRDDEVGDLARTLSEMTEAMWQRMDAIEAFAADVAHEIKNPLTSLRSAVETAARIKDAEQQRNLMSIIQEDVQRLDRLISDISDASRLDAELSRAETAPIDLNPMLAILADIDAATRNDGDPDLEIDIGTGNGLTVDGVEGRLVQVLRNLLANARSFSPPDAVIALRGRREDDWVRIEIDDSGPGIPDGKEEAIFDRFYSQRPESEKFGTHSGLGLSISKQIIEAHGGTIRAENRRQADGRVVGARFIVRLPAGDPAPKGET